MRRRRLIETTPTTSEKVKKSARKEHTTDILIGVPPRFDDNKNRCSDNRVWLLVGEAMLLIEGVVGQRLKEEERKEYATPDSGSVFRRPVVLCG